MLLEYGVIAFAVVLAVILFAALAISVYGLFIALKDALVWFASLFTKIAATNESH